MRVQDESDGVEVDGLGIDEPRILYAADIARLYSSPGREWTTRRAKRWLKRSGIGFQMDAAGAGEGQWATTSLEIAEHYPMLWRLVMARLVDEL